MSEERELKFVRLRTLPEDLIGYVTYKPECVVIETPLKIEVETFFEEGRQILCMQEYLPQTVIGIKEIEIPTSDIMFVTPVKEEFVEQYEYVRDFFYNNESKIKNPLAPKKTETIPETAEKVVSILEALASKKDKPVH
jgi:hypothetical protein